MSAMSVCGWSLGMDQDRGPQFIETQGALRQPGEWFLCEHPERQPEGLTAIHDCCRPCFIGATAMHRRDEADLSAELLDFLRGRLDAWGEAPRLAVGA